MCEKECVYWLLVVGGSDWYAVAVGHVCGPATAMWPCPTSAAFDILDAVQRSVLCTAVLCCAVQHRTGDVGCHAVSMSPCTMSDYSGLRPLHMLHVAPCTNLSWPQHFLGWCQMLLLLLPTRAFRNSMSGCYYHQEMHIAAM